jgi:F0F1-type ATP synthase assembly protein I
MASIARAIRRTALRKPMSLGIFDGLGYFLDGAFHSHPWAFVTLEG